MSSVHEYPGPRELLRTVEGFFKPGEKVEKKEEKREITASKAVRFTYAEEFKKWFSEIKIGISLGKLLNKVNSRTNINYFKKHALSPKEQLATLENMSHALSNAVAGRKELLSKLEKETTTAQVRQLGLKFWKFTTPERMKETVEIAEQKLTELKQQIKTLKTQIEADERVTQVTGRFMRKDSSRLADKYTDKEILDHIKEALREVEKKGGKLRIAKDGSFYREKSESVDQEWATNKKLAFLSTVGGSKESAEALLKLIEYVEEIKRKKITSLGSHIEDVEKLLLNEKQNNPWIAGLLRNNPRREEIQQKMDNLFALPSVEKIAKKAGEEIPISRFFDRLFDPQNTKAASWLIAIPRGMPTPDVMIHIAQEIDRLNSEMATAEIEEQRASIQEKLKRAELFLARLEKMVNPKHLEDPRTKDALFNALYSLYTGGYKSKDFVALQAYSRLFDPRQLLPRLVNDYKQIDGWLVSKQRRGIDIDQIAEEGKNQKLALLNFCRVWVAHDHANAATYDEPEMKDNLRLLLNLAKSDKDSAVRKSANIPIKPLPPPKKVREEKKGLSDIRKFSLNDAAMELLLIGKQTPLYQERLQELARNITMEQAILFSKIEPREFLKADSKVDQQKLSSNLSNFIENYNYFANRVAQTIFLDPKLSPEQQGELISMYIDLADALYDQGNLSGAQAIITGLSITDVRQLKEAWAYLPQEQLLKFKDYSDITFSNEKWGANARESENEFAGKPCIPCMNFYSAMLDMTTNFKPFKNEMAVTATLEGSGDTILHLMELRENLNADASKMTYSIQ